MRETSLGEEKAEVDASSAALGRLRGHRRARTIDIQVEAKNQTQLPVSPRSPTFPDHRDTLPLSLSPDTSCRMSTAGNVNVVTPPRKMQPQPQPVTRTMEEKKAILGSMLGNVDTLVEGVKKAGIWGLG